VISWTQLLLILATVIALSAGQVLFKLAADALTFDNGVTLATLIQPRLLIALTVYASATILWLWVLRITPLRLAYPFVGLAFIFVPLLAYFLLDESIDANTFLGGGLILAGIWVSVGRS